MRIICIICLLVISVSSCRKKNDTVISDSPPQVTLKFQNTFNGQALKLKSVYYKTANNDSLVINAYLYYISNIKLYTASGDVFAETESYHLINQEFDSTKEFTITNIPAGSYTKISFLIGVDSIRNISGAQTGQLDPMNGMFWDWNQGYVMARLEGFSPQISPYPNNLGYHIAGFKSIYNAVKSVTLQLPKTIQVGTNNKPVLTLQSDISEWFKTPNLIDITQLSTVTSISSGSATLAENYADMFSVYDVQTK